MQVILREDVDKLGRTGDVVRVKDGYGRNFLLPRGLAVVADLRNTKRAEHERQVAADRQRTRATDAEALRKKVEGASVNVAKRVGAEGKLFGSVTTKEIAEALSAQGIAVDKKAITLAAPIKSLGVHNAALRLAPEVTAEIKVWVVEK